MKKRMLFFMLIIFIAKGTFAYRPVYFNRAATLQKGALTMRLYYLKTWFNSMYNPKEDAMADLPDTVNISLNAGNLFLSYGLVDGITVGLNSVFLSKSFENGIVSKSGSGLGDISNLVKIALIKNKSFYLSGAVFVKWATGKYENIEKNEMPLGTGTVDISIKTLMDIRIAGLWIYIIPTYTITGKSDEVDTGDSVSLVTTFSFPIPVVKGLFGELSLNGFYKFEDKSLAGTTIEKSDTYIVSVAPAVQYAVTKKLFVQTLGEIVLDTKDTFGKSFTLKTGISYKF